MFEFWNRYFAIFRDETKEIGFGVFCVALKVYVSRNEFSYIFL